MLDPSNPFILYADCHIEYDGRAYSKLDRGNYLIIVKKDKSVQIHAADKIPPRNYQGQNSIISIDNNILTVVNKKEIIKITIFTILNLSYLENWSEKSLQLTRTESELVDSIVSNINNYIEDDIISIQKEYKTPCGPIDIGIVSKSRLHLIEVKRNTITTNNVYQLKKYVDSLEGPISPYIAGPNIRDNAKSICDKNGIKYIQIGF